MLSRRQILGASAAAPWLLSEAPRLFGAEYDLVIRGGRVVDPSQRIDRITDVAIRAGKIAAIDHRHAQAAHRRVPRNRGAVDTAADYREIELVVAKSCETRLTIQSRAQMHLAFGIVSLRDLPGRNNVPRSRDRRDCDSRALPKTRARRVR